MGNVTPIRTKHSSVRAALELTDRVVVITGGAGFLGMKHAEAVVEMGGVAILLDMDEQKAVQQAAGVAARWGGRAVGLGCDITDVDAVAAAANHIIRDFKKIDALINNAANNPKADSAAVNLVRLETFSSENWAADIAVGLTGAFLCSQRLGSLMAESGGGVIINVASDLAIIAPDQRLYRKENVTEDEQPTKPVSYSVVKSGLLGLTRYLATYWLGRNVRCNALIPGGVFANQDPVFVDRIARLIPLGRMAHEDEYKAAVAFLLSDGASYMNGANLVIDGGRTCW